MTFYDYAKDIISERLKSRDTLKKVVENIKDVSANGQLAFYPCSKYTRIILNNIKIHAPEILPRVIGCFDNSDEANTAKGIDVYNIKRLDEFKDKFSLLVVASNAFYTKELSAIKQLTNYDGPILRTSYFDISLPGDMEDKEILSKIEEVYDLLADQKSKVSYLTTWISLLLNDEGLTYLFEDENEPSAQFGNYILQGMDDSYMEENPSDLYEMRYVTLEKGDIVFDIGAFKGDTAIFIADSVGREGGVYSFEPVKSNYDYLVKNIKLNGLQDIVLPINKGCSDKSGVLRANTTKSGAPWAFLSEDEGDEMVQVITIDDFVESNSISKLDFIKMDVEGWEYKVILGALNTIKRFKPKLVIPLYHKSSDLLTIPLLMNEIGGYKLYLRCKTTGVFGNNLYFDIHLHCT